MSAKKKESVYIEADEDITSVLSRIAKIKSPVIALTPAKRSETLRSLVNVKLLQRAAKKQQKRIVIISKDPVVKRLAASTGLYSAATPTSKPVLEKPPTPKKKSKDVAGQKTTKDESTKAKPKQTKSASAATDTPPKKELKVPNFGVFRKRLGLTVLGLVAIPILLVLILRSLPSATIVISTNARQVDASAAATLDFAEAASVSVDEGLLPAQLQTSRVQITQEITATGELDIGQKASGSITVSNCTDNPITVPAQTAFSDSGLSFLSQQELNLESGNFTGNGDCKPDGGHVQTVGVTAQESGDQFNLSARQYSAGSLASGVVAQGSVMSGGSSEVIRVIQQSDIDTANTLLQEKRDDQAVQQELQELLVSSSLLPIDDSFDSSAGAPSSDVEVDEEIGSGLLTLTIDYSLVGVQQADVLNFLLPSLESAAGDLDLLDSGIEQTVLETTKTDDIYSLEMTISGSAGALLDADSVFQQIKDRKGAEAAAELRQREGVTQVDVDTSPFWNTTIPDDISKVNIQINGQQ